jgi:hypothetical protein
VPGKSALSLVKPGPRKIDKRPTFHTDDVVLRSGVYRVRHQKHRLPHEVTLLRDQRFPRCAKCQRAVVFELIQAADMEATVASDQSTRIYLYELPVLDDNDESVAV